MHHSTLLKLNCPWWNQEQACISLAEQKQFNFLTALHRDKLIDEKPSARLGTHELQSSVGPFLCHSVVGKGIRVDALAGGKGRKEATSKPQCRSACVTVLHQLPASSLPRPQWPRLYYAVTTPGHTQCATRSFARAGWGCRGVRSWEGQWNPKDDYFWAAEKGSQQNTGF